MRKSQFFLLWRFIVVLAVCVSGSVFAQLADVTQPSDPIIASSGNSPGSEGVRNAIDNAPTKYLNFDSGRDGTNAGFSPSGFVVSPGVGLTLIRGIAIESANDAAERDPRTFRLEGSTDATITNFNSGNWTEIVTISNNTYTARFQTNRILFPNDRPYRHYRWTVLATTSPNTCCMQVAEVELLGTTLPLDVTQPSDPIIASSGNSPGSEGVRNAIDNAPTKYLNFDSGRDGTNAGFSPSGFVVSPQIGKTLVTGIAIESANDAAERDAKTVRLEGSNDGTVTNFNSGNWEVITILSNNTYTARFQTNIYFFANAKPYRHYRWTVLATTTPNTCCMQVAEVELLGTTAPVDVTQPSDPIIASSGNSPGSEGARNAIDNAPTKYLNFDSGRDGTNAGFSPSGFVVSPAVGPTTIIGLAIESANDAAERDPKTIRLEGSNDGTITNFNSGNWELITIISNNTYTARFQTNESYFLNDKAYKHYRWTVLATASPNTCCMQVAEVEFLAPPQGGNTNAIETLIRRQPLDTPVLLGATATFRVVLTGPWTVQWFRNGVAVPGANAALYTTPSVTATNDGDRYYAVVQSSQGTQRSDQVLLSIFTPSATKSVGVSWLGSGANGAPTAVLPTDITGFFPQAYWNNFGGGSGGPSAVTNSDNAASPITVQWATSGEWGTGTGTSDGTERMLNGLVTGRATTAPGATVTLANVPAGTHSLLLYSVQVPLEFASMDFSVTTHNTGGDVVQRRYIRPQNSDEYNPAPGFVLVTATNAAGRGVGNMMRFDNLQPGSDGQIVINFFTSSGLGAQGPGLNGMQLVLNAPPVPAPPVITQQPVSANGITNGQATFTVQAAGTNITYQWNKNGLPIQGATSATLTLFLLDTNDIATYNVAIQNAAGRVVSRSAKLNVLASDQITAGMFAYFKFDDDDVIASNSVAGSKQGAVIGSSLPDWPSGQFGRALLFDGNVYVLVSDYPKFSGAGTVAGWVNASGTEWGPIINDWVGANTVGQRGQFFVNVSGGATPAARGVIGVGPNEPTAVGAISAAPNTWHHFALTLNGLTLSLYWDGQLLNSVDYLGNVNTPPVPWLAIGANLTTDTNAPPTGTPPTFKGLIDDLAMWNRSLSDIEIQAIYSGGTAGQNLTQIAPVITTAPRLLFARTGPLTPPRKGTNVTLSWPSSFTGFVLQSRAAVSSGTWTNVPNVVSNSITLSNQTGSGVFRLFKP